MPTRSILALILLAVLPSGALALDEPTPALRERIARLALGHVEQGFAPLGQLAQAERRIAVRRWASAPVPAPIRRMREAA